MVPSAVRCNFNFNDPSGYIIFNKFAASNCNGKAEKEEERNVMNMLKNIICLGDSYLKIKFSI